MVVADSNNPDKWFLEVHGQNYAYLKSLLEAHLNTLPPDQYKLSPAYYLWCSFRDQYRKQYKEKFSLDLPKEDFKHGHAKPTGHDSAL